MDLGRGTATVVRPAGADHIDQVDQVDHVDQLVRDLFGLVADGVVRCIDAFLDADRAVAGAVARRDLHLDHLQDRIEELALDELTAVPPPPPPRVRFLVAVLRIVPELERSGDLVQHIALRTGVGLASSLSPRARGLVADMGAAAAAMWRVAADAYANRNPVVADRLRRDDDELDDLHVALTAELSAATLPVSVAIELGLLARFLERLGDHAVNVTHRLDEFSS